MIKNQFVIFFLVEDMIKEVDVDGDGRIDFYGKKVLWSIFDKCKIFRICQRPWRAWY